MGNNIAFVPIRSGSKSIPQKNLKLFCGKPLFYWVINSLEKSKSVDKIILASNINEVKDIISEYNFSKLEYFERSEQNAQDDSTTESVLLEYLNLKKDNLNDKIILTQATSPFTQPEDFDKALIKMNHDKLDSIFSCVEFKSSCGIKTQNLLIMILNSDQEDKILFSITREWCFLYFYN